MKYIEAISKISSGLFPHPGLSCGVAFLAQITSGYALQKAPCLKAHYLKKSRNLFLRRLLLFLFAALLAVSCGKEIRLNTSDVPSAVIIAFNQRYPEARDIKWKAEEEGGFYFEASFLLNNKEKEVHYKTDGTFVEEEK